MNQTKPFQKLSVYLSRSGCCATLGSIEMRCLTCRRAGTATIATTAGASFSNSPAEFAACFRAGATDRRTAREEAQSLDKR